MFQIESTVIRHKRLPFFARLLCAVLALVVMSAATARAEEFRVPFTVAPGMAPWELVITGQEQDGWFSAQGLVLYEQGSNRLVQELTIPGGLGDLEFYDMGENAVRFLDLNFDGSLDILINYNRGSQISNDHVWVFDPGDAHYVYSKSVSELSYVDVDKEKKVLTEYSGGFYGYFGGEYRLQGSEDLTLVRSKINQCDEKGDCQQQVRERNAQGVMERVGELFLIMGRYTGLIDGKYEFAMRVEADEDAGTISGEYFYVSQKKPIRLSGLIKPGGDFILHEMVEGESTGYFQAVWGYDEIRGTWTSGDGKRVLPFSMEVKEYELAFTWKELPPLKLAGNGLTASVLEGTVAQGVVLGQDKAVLDLVIRNKSGNILYQADPGFNDSDEPVNFTGDGFKGYGKEVVLSTRDMRGVSGLVITLVRGDGKTKELLFKYENGALIPLE